MTIPTPNLGPGIVTSRVRDMTATEARLCVQRINAGMNETRKLLLELYERKGWLALGYSNWRECAVKEFGESASRLYQQLKAGQIEKEISTVVEIEMGTIPERQLRGLDVETVRQAIAEPHYEQHEDATEPLSQTVEQPIARGVKEIIARAKELKAKLKTDKREARKQAVAENGKTFNRVTTVGSVEIHCADSRHLHEFVTPGSVQLVITSPPYNVGMDYSNHDDNMSDSDYAALLQAVFAECFDALCDGGRIAVVVPYGVGRHPWKPVAAVVADHVCAVGFELLGQIVWHKGTFNTSTSWGTYRSPACPILRDTNEAIIIAQKGGVTLQVPDSIFVVDEVGKHSPFLSDKNEFMRLVTDYWPIGPESSERIGHPAPFPVKLVENLIRLYAYPGATVLDPFAGSGTVGVEAKQLGCRAILSEIDAGYCALARDRCEKAQ